MTILNKIYCTIPQDQNTDNATNQILNRIKTNLFITINATTAALFYYKTTFQ